MTNSYTDGIELTGDATHHLPATTVAAYVQGELEAAARDEAESHLATCATCRHELVEVGRLVAKRERERLGKMALGVAAVASLMLVVGVLRTSVPRAGDRGAVERAPAPGGARAVTALSPGIDATLPSGRDVRFTWHAVAGGSTYRLTLLSESGALLWATATGDTTVSLPDDIQLAPSGAYFWYVDALSADGSTLTSGARRFAVE
ncbi:MAG TPA: zf-HC2 domain-containing protein [Gemmatimonadales bacterium]|nr:zf-HC2 domain-containing protein [Gemmatimonadales bacterium]